MIIKGEKNCHFLEKKQNVDGYVIFAICTIFTIFHFLCANFAKTMETYPDELFYYGIPRELINGRGISFRAIKFGFQKIAYSFAILPAFLIKNANIRNSVIALLNSIMMTSSIIPLLSISKTLRLKKSFRYILVIQTLLLPDMLFCMTFMSENLYWPLFLSFVAIWFKSMNSKGVLFSVFSAAVCYFCYLCKELILAVIPAYIIFELLIFLFRFLEYKSVKKAFDKERFSKLFVFTLSFSTLFLFVNFVFFRTVKNLYYEIGIVPSLTKYSLAYILYGFVILLATGLLGTFFFPLIYPAINFKCLDQRAKELFAFIGLLFVILIMTVSYLITGREDLGNEIPRTHLRYISPLFPIFFAIFYSLIQKKNNDIHTSFWAHSIPALIFFFVFKGVASGSAIDHASLLWYEAVQSRVGVLSRDNGMTISLYAWLLNFFLCFVWSLIHFCFRKDKGFGITVFTIYVLSFSVVDNVLLERRLKKGYEIPDRLKQSIKTVKLLQKKDEDILFLGSFISKESKLFDMYFENTERIIYSDESDLKLLTTEIPVEDIQFYESIYHIPYRKLFKISYIVTLAGSSITPLNANICSELSDQFFTVYEKKNPFLLGFKDTKEYKKEFSYSFNGQNILNGFDKDKVRYIRPEGRSFGPYVALEKGSYTAIIKGKNLSFCGIEVYSQFGKNLHTFTVNGTDENKVILFSLKEASDNLEICVQNNGDEIIEMTSFTISKDLE